MADKVFSMEAPVEKVNTVIEALRDYRVDLVKLRLPKKARSINRFVDEETERADNLLQELFAFRETAYGIEPDDLFTNDEDE